MPAIIYPETKRVDVVEDHFGRTVTDHYRWLESPVHGDPEVSRWVKAQNAVTQDYLASLPGRDILRERLAALLDYEQFSLPVQRGNATFFTRNPGGDNQASLLVREDGRDRVLINPNAWSDDSTVALAEWSVSADGQRVAYGVQQGGTDWRTIRVLDVATGKTLKDQVTWVRYATPEWAPDGSGFFYSRYPEPADGAGLTAGVANHAVHFHALGTAQADDRLVHADPDNPQLLHFAYPTEDGRYLTLYHMPGSGVTALSVIDLESRDWTPRKLIQGFDAAWAVVGNDGDLLYLTTTDGAERGRIVTLDLSEADPKPVEIVPEDAATLKSAVLIGGRLMTTYLVDANTEVRRFLPDGTPDGTVPLPGIGSASSFSGQSDASAAFFLYSSYNTPITVYHYDIAANTYTTWAAPDVTADLDGIVVEQQFYASKDGTRIPVFIIRRKDVTAAAPTILTGYGGFGISLVPVYNPTHMAWVEQGGVLAVANLRGGGEYGRAWHAAGQFGNKQNVFDDFIAAAEYLIAEGIAPEGGLAVEGASNGGLLVGAVVNQRPDLFAAALPGVGVMDMLRFHKFTGGTIYFAEYGNPEDDGHFENLRAYSPYHNIRAGTDYPAILAPTAESDDRVVPAHTFKYVAALQAGNLGPNPRLMRVETRAGHGGGMPLDKTVALYADMWAFAAEWTGLTLSPIE